MKIQSIASYNNYYQNNTPRKINKQYRPFLQETQKRPIAFTGSRLGAADALIRLFHINPLNHFNDFSRSEYLKLSKSEIMRLRKRYDKIFSPLLGPNGNTETEVLHSYAANCVKKVFDTQFGEGNYTVLTIGRSLSSIGKVLGYKIGEDNVHNIPMSSVGRYNYNIANPLNYFSFLKNLKQDNVASLTKYLESIGLSRKNIETSGKKYILTDFCYTGHSLIGVENVFKSDFVWGSKSDNVFGVDFIKALSAIDEKSLFGYYVNPTEKQENLAHCYKLFNEFKEGFHIVEKLENSLIHNEYKKYSQVTKSYNFDNIFKAAKTGVTSSRFLDFYKQKIVWFKHLDNEMSGAFNHVQLGIKDSVINREKKIPGQQPLLWNSLISQFESDLRNDITEVNKLFVKIYDSQMRNSLGSDICEPVVKLHKKLYSYFTKVFVEKDVNYVYDYYQMRSFLQSILKDIKSS